MSLAPPSAPVATPVVPVQRMLLAGLGLLTVVLWVHLAGQSVTQALLLPIGIGLGISLYHASFGFTAAYRRAMTEKDLSGLVAQAVMLIVAMSLFAPVLSAGEIFGHPAGGSVAPVDTAMLIGAFLFGIGMQLGGGCASGTLFTVGGGNVRMMVTSVFFCLCCWLATLNMADWRALPSLGAYSLGREIGYCPAVAVQTGALGLILLALWRTGARIKRPLWQSGFDLRCLVRGPWPLILGALGLAVLNFAILAVAGHPWGVTWGYTIWAGKVAAAVGWDPAGSAYWSVPWRADALEGSILSDHSSLTNIGILIGAAIAGSLAGKVHPSWRIPLKPLMAAVLGGLMMGYGARLAYGCNIGAFFSGVASTSLHGWAWIVMAMAGSWIGLRLRPSFRLDG